MTETLDLEARERAVTDARRLCEKAKAIPARAALYGLQRQAMSTPATAEVALFARYQATRTTGPNRDGEAAFYRSVAELIEQEPYSGDIDRTRFLLGMVTRAALVATAERGPGRSRTGGRR